MLSAFLHLPRYVVLFVILMLWQGVNFFIRRSKGKSILDAKLPVVLKYDAWHTAPTVAILLMAGVFLGHMLSQLSSDFARHPPQNPAAIFELEAMFALVGIVYLFGIGLVFLRMLLPDRVVLQEDAISLSSRGRTRRWGWGQIADVTLKSMNFGRGGTRDVVCLSIVGEKKPVLLPNFLRSADGPAEEDDIYELVRGLFSASRGGVKWSGQPRPFWKPVTSRGN